MCQVFVILNILVLSEFIKQDGLQIWIEHTRKTIPDFIDCTYSHQPHNNVLFTLIKKSY